MNRFTVFAIVHDEARSLTSRADEIWSAIVALEAENVELWRKLASAEAELVDARSENAKLRKTLEAVSGLEESHAKEDADGVWVRADAIDAILFGEP